MTESLPSPGRRTRLLNMSGYLGAAVLLLAVGGGVLAYLIWTKPSPSGQTEREPGRLVRVMRAQETSHRIRVTAYGETRASEVWTAKAEVQGQAVEVNPQFEPGELLPEGLKLVTIDPTDYDLAKRRLEAEVRQEKEALVELDQNETNLKAIDKLQGRQLKLAEYEYRRQRQVFEKNAASRSSLENAENAYVQALTAVQEIRNKLALIPVQRELLRASLDVANAQLSQAVRDLEKCEIRLPMAARCASKSVEDNQYVTPGEQLGTFLALDTTEVVTMVEARKMGALFHGGIQALGSLDLTKAAKVKELWKRVHIGAEVRWALGDRRPVWYGRLARIGSALDPGTRTIPVIIEIADPYKDVQPGVRPPLIPDVFCEVTLYGATVDDVVLIPRDALRDDRVYLLRDGKLHMQPVKVLVLEEDMAVISEGIEAGDEVILTDLFPASEGMPLRGEVVENPIGPPQPVDFPKDLFEEPKKPATAEGDSRGAEGSPPAAEASP